MKYIAYTFELTRRLDDLTLETAYDLLGAELAEIGFESFEQNETCLRAYIPASTDIASAAGSSLAILVRDPTGHQLERTMGKEFLPPHSDRRQMPRTGTFPPDRSGYTAGADYFSSNGLRHRTP